LFLYITVNSPCYTHVVASSRASRCYIVRIKLSISGLIVILLHNWLRHILNGIKFVLFTHQILCKLKTGVDTNFNFMMTNTGTVSELKKQTNIKGCHLHWQHSKHTWFLMNELIVSLWALSSPRRLVGDFPQQVRRPPGGILADEMGLGKTVEVLACMLLHPRAHIPPPAPLPVIPGHTRLLIMQMFYLQEKIIEILLIPQKMQLPFSMRRLKKKEIMF